MKRYSPLLALTALVILLSAAQAQRPQPGITRLSPSPASLGRDRFINTTPPVVMGTPFPFFAGAGSPNGNAFPFAAARLRRQIIAASVLNNSFDPFNRFGSGFGFGLNSGYGGGGGGYQSMRNYGYGASYGSGNYGSGYGSGYGANVGGTDLLNPTRPDVATSGVGTILGVSGVPAQNGKIAWPLGLRLLRIDDLLRQIEAQLQLAAAGGANDQLAGEIRDNIETVRQTLDADKTWRFSMPLAVYEDSEQFLRKLAKVPTRLKPSAPVELKTRPLANPYPGKPY